MKPTTRLSLFIVSVVGLGWLIGATNLPGAWYAQLTKPAVTPPNWAFPIAWTVLYIMIAIAGWRTVRHEPMGPAIVLWFAQLVLNFLWSPVMFTMHRIDVALAIIIGLLIAILAYIALEYERDRPAAALFLPYAAWVSFATYLNAQLWRLN